LKPRIASLIGIARKAGKVYSGESQVEALLKKKQGTLLIIAEDCPGAFTKFSRWAQDLGIPVIRTGSKLQLGSSIGLSPRSTILIDDQGFTKAILKEWEQT
jgi:ribosomal protein L7Ae-like RNA K-turn-binding protein